MQLAPLLSSKLGEEVTVTPPTATGGPSIVYVALPRQDNQQVRSPEIGKEEKKNPDMVDTPLELPQEAIEHFHKGYAAIGDKMPETAVEHFHASVTIAPFFATG